MRRSLLDRWCGKPWLAATYSLGIVMFCVLVVKWPDWDAPQRIMGLLTVILPLHVFEELTWPNGFQFMMNKLIQRSENPLAYPENRLTDMLTNFGAEILFILLLILTPSLGGKVVVFAIFFGIGETLVHTVFSIVALRHYRPMGKKTLYSPGFVTAWCMLLEVGIYGLYWLAASGTFDRSDLWGLALVAFLIIFMIRLPFIISNRKKSTRFAYDSKGYFEKFE